MHNKHYELFCSICNLNLCSNCKDEHQHYSHYGITDFVKEDKTKVENIINKDEKNNKAINVERLRNLEIKTSMNITLI